jgi:hypothetical protein
MAQDESTSSWPKFEQYCYLLGYATIVGNATPEERERIYQLERDHFVKTDGASLKKLSPRAWQHWVNAGRPR